MLTILTRFLTNESGATAIGALTALGGSLNTLFTTVSSAVSTATSGG